MQSESLEHLHRLAGLSPGVEAVADLLKQMAAITEFCRALPAAEPPVPESESDAAAATPPAEPDRPLAVPLVRRNAPLLRGGLFITPTPKPGSEP